jgi:hypothetical protein
VGSLYKLRALNPTKVERMKNKIPTPKPSAIEPQEATTGAELSNLQAALLISFFVIWLVFVVVIKFMGI